MSSSRKSLNIQIVKNKAKKSAVSEHATSFYDVNSTNTDDKFLVGEVFFNNSDFEMYKELHNKYPLTDKNKRINVWKTLSVIYDNTDALLPIDSHEFYGQENEVAILEKEGLITLCSSSKVKGSFYKATKQGAIIAKLHNILKNYKKIEYSNERMLVADGSEILPSYNSFAQAKGMIKQIRFKGKNVFYKYFIKRYPEIILITNGSDTQSGFENSALGKEMKDHTEEKRIKEYIKKLVVEADTVAVPKCYGLHNNTMIFSAVVNGKNAIVHTSPYNVGYFYKLFGKDIEFRIFSKDIDAITQELEFNPNPLKIKNKMFNGHTGELTSPVAVIKNDKIAGMIMGIIFRENFKPIIKNTVNYSTEFEAINTLVSLSKSI